jgi:membrane protein DedA with SNARE-associated domain
VDRVDPMEFLESHLDFLLRHLLAVVFVGFLVEAAGVPFPSRLLLLVAATLASGPEQFVGLIAASTAGALIGDHVPYVAGMLTGPRILAFYCRITLGSEQCVEKTLGYFRRFGAAAILLSRFSHSVRLFASALSGCGHITYRRFIGYDIVGTLFYTALWVTIGYLVGEQAAALLGRHGGPRVLLIVAPVAFAALVGYRLWRRSRYGPARPEQLREQASCVNPQAK